MEQYYRIAGLTVKMATFGRTERQARPYLCEKVLEPDITMYPAQQIVKQKYPTLSDDDCEYLATGAVFYKELLNYDGFQLHSSAVVVDERAYLFTADCGTGKSTHAGLWLKLFGERAYILNDDKPALRRENNGWYAYGTPWSGKNDISIDRRIPVAGIAAIEQAPLNSIKPYNGIDAVHTLLRQSNRPKAPAYRIKLLELLDHLITHVPIWRLSCNMDPEAALVSYEAMSGKMYR